MNRKIKYLTTSVIGRLEKYEPIYREGVEKYFGGVKGVILGDLTLRVIAQMIAENRLKMTTSEIQVDKETGKRRKVEAMKPNRVGAIGISQIRQSTFDDSDPTTPDIKSEHPEIGSDLWDERTNILAGIIYDAWLFGRLRKVMPTLPYPDIMDWVYAEYNWRLGLWELFGKVEQRIPIDKLPHETQKYIIRIGEIYSELLLLNSERMEL